MKELTDAPWADADLVGTLDASLWSKRLIARALEYGVGEDDLLAWFSGAFETGARAVREEPGWPSGRQLLGLLCVLMLACLVLDILIAVGVL